MTFGFVAKHRGAWPVNLICEALGVSRGVFLCLFQADGPNQKWVADFTCIWAAEGWLYVATVLDLYSRRIVGWSMQESMTSQWVVDALMMSVWRGVSRWHCCIAGPRKSVHQRALGITCSMSRAGDVWDNSAMESFFSSMKTERTARKVYRSRGRLAPMCSTTSSASTTQRVGIRHWATSAPYSSNKLKKLRSVSTKPVAAHKAQSRLYRCHSQLYWPR